MQIAAAKVLRSELGLRLVGLRLTILIFSLQVNGNVFVGSLCPGGLRLRRFKVASFMP